MGWQLIQVSKTEWIQDDSGYYTLIHYIKENCRKCNKSCSDCIDGHVRLDIMDKDDMPVMSFQGTADNIRKWIMQGWAITLCISLEHAAYIGAELARCAILQDKYIQD